VASYSSRATRRGTRGWARANGGGKDRVLNAEIKARAENASATTHDAAKNGGPVVNTATRDRSTRTPKRTSGTASRKRFAHGTKNASRVIPNPSRHPTAINYGPAPTPPKDRTATIVNRKNAGTRNARPNRTAINLPNAHAVPRARTGVTLRDLRALRGLMTGVMLRVLRALRGLMIVVMLRGLMTGVTLRVLRALRGLITSVTLRDLRALRGPMIGVMPRGPMTGVMLRVLRALRGLITSVTLRALRGRMIGVMPRGPITGVMLRVLRALRGLITSVTLRALRGPIISATLRGLSGAIVLRAETTSAHAATGNQKVRAGRARSPLVQSRAAASHGAAVEADVAASRAADGDRKAPVAAVPPDENRLGRNHGAQNRRAASLRAAPVVHRALVPLVAGATTKNR
jgi:hypothetical protein